MPDNIFSIVAPAACSGGALILPILPAIPCQLAPKRSELDLLIFKGSGAGPTDMAITADWASKIDNTDATGVKMKYVIGRGTIGDPEDTVFNAARDETVITDRVRTVVFEVFEISDAVTYDFLRTLQPGVIKPNIYYKSMGNFLYGKKVAAATDDGIAINSISVTFPKEAGKEAVDKAVITIKFSSTVDPDRVPYPLTL
jgi:hypothetical protein